ncbi:MAG: sialate O-acetylesterase [Fibrobacterota bacterium]|nr:MAG: sialate O-acetylesterase [Fibrobacterota bacterium]
MKIGMWKSSIALTLAGLALAPQANAQVDPNFYVFLAFGQSNMEGYATDFGGSDKVSLPRFQVLGATTCTGLQRTKDKWSPGIAPLFRCGTGLSPADYFARTLVDSLPTHIKIGMVPVAVAGSKIDGFDPSTGVAYYSKEASWMQNIVKEYDGNPYARLVAMGKIAKQTGVIKGILLHQGESNAGENVTVWGGKVKKVYDALIKDLGLDAKQVPLLAGEVANAGGMNNTIDQLPSVISTSYVIKSTSLATHANDGTKLHFSAASYREFGKRYAVQMLAYLRSHSSVSPTAPPEASLAGDYAVYDIRGTKVAGFHAGDALAVEAGWNSVRTGLSGGIYWMKNLTTGVNLRMANGI